VRDADPDGAWCVEVVQHGRTRWYPILNDVQHVTVGWLGIAGVQHVLDVAGIDVAELVPDGLSTGGETTGARDATVGR
jgi:hypothetical protein